MSSVRVQSAEEWQRLRGLADSVFDLNSRLPSAVSSLRVSESPLFDGDVIFGESGWGLVSSLALVHSDPTVNVLVVEPDSAAFLSSTGEFGGFSCRSDGAADCYLAGLFGEPSSGPAGQIGYVAETAALFGTSGRWGIWVERNVAGLVVSSDPSALGGWELENGPFLGVDDALEGFLGTNLGYVTPGSEFASSLRRHYGTFSDN
jgi:hypothetical protein